MDGKSILLSPGYKVDHIVPFKVTKENPPMKEVVSKRALKQLPYGKYTIWAQRLSTESLEALLWAVGVFGAIYNDARNDMGHYLIPILAPQVGTEKRMRNALEVIASVQAGGDFPAWGFDNPRPAFTHEFRDRLTKADSYENWVPFLTKASFIRCCGRSASLVCESNRAQMSRGNKIPCPR